MIRRKVLDTLAAKGPLTIDELQTETGVPRATLRASLTTEHYRQVEVDHPEHGRVTAWAIRPSVVRVDGSNHYFLAKDAA